jgi:UPF0755 protein
LRDPFAGNGSRMERRRETAASRSRRRRRVIVVAVVALLVAAGIGAAGVTLYRRFAGEDNPEPVTFRVIVPEGLTIGQTAERVDVQTGGSISSGRFVDAAQEAGYDHTFLEGSGGTIEGFLFPKTYEVTDEMQARDVVEMMLDQFGLETRDLEWSRAEDLGLDRYQVLIVASMIEKEASLPDERPVIASVMYNRLRAQMRLQIDATVQYALGEWKPELSYEDLEVDSRYNTYKVDGLPPTPICNPGFESIRAALYPAETDYLYYLLTSPEGRHSFTADYDQFLKWKQEQNQ